MSQKRIKHEHLLSPCCAPAAVVSPFMGAHLTCQQKPVRLVLSSAFNRHGSEGQGHIVNG